MLCLVPLAVGTALVDLSELPIVVNRAMERAEIGELAGKPTTGGSCSVLSALLADSLDLLYTLYSKGESFYASPLLLLRTALQNRPRALFHIGRAI